MNKAAVLMAWVVPATMSGQVDYFADAPVWNSTSVCNVQGGSQGNCIAYDTYNYVVTGDSLIDGHSWSRIERSGTISYSWQGGPPPPPPICTGTETYEPYLVGLLRQDGTRILQWSDGAEHLLYDFDLAVGDTLPVTLNNWNTTVTVAAIDSFPVGTGWRKRFELANSWALYLLEGIGSSHGLFEPITDFFDCGYALNCYGLGEEGYYPEAGPGCLIPMAVPVERLRDPQLRAFPVPASDRIVILADRPGSGTIVNVSDMSGRQLGRVVLREGRGELDVTGLPGGCLLLSSGEWHQRVLVAH